MGSNFIGARNEEFDPLEKVPENVINDVRNDWTKQGKIWEINPPQASHMGGVWERAIGQIRQIIQAYLLPINQRLLSREEFHTMILHAARIVNSTPHQREKYKTIVLAHRHHHICNNGQRQSRPQSQDTTT